VSGGIEWRIDVANSERINVRLDALPNDLKRRLKKEIATITRELLVAVQAREPVRTGALRRATRSFVDERPDFIRGRVRVLRGAANLGARFGALEYGGPGRRGPGRRVEVKAYSRGGVRVDPYRRRPPTIRGLRFLRGPAAGMRARMLAALQAVLNEFVAEFNRGS
jgi:hypothetical protein